MNANASDKSKKRRVRITHRRTNTLLADGPLGWGITPFEGNLYIGKKYLCTDRFKANFIPGLCIYKFFYVWMDLRLNKENTIKSIAWMYWLPNPLLPFIWLRVAVPRTHPELDIEEY